MVNNKTKEIVMKATSATVKVGWGRNVNVNLFHLSKDQYEAVVTVLGANESTKDVAAMITEAKVKSGTDFYVREPKVKEPKVKKVKAVKVAKTAKVEATETPAETPAVSENTEADASAVAAG